MQCECTLGVMITCELLYECLYTHKPRPQIINRDYADLGCEEGKEGVSFTSIFVYFLILICEFVSDKTH